MKYKKTRNLISESKSKWRWMREANWFLFGMCSLSWRLHDWLCWFNLNFIFRFLDRINFFPFTFRSEQRLFAMHVKFDGSNRTTSDCGISWIVSCWDARHRLNDFSHITWQMKHELWPKSEKREIYTHVWRNNIVRDVSGKCCVAQIEVWRDLTVDDESLRVISIFHTFFHYSFAFILR